MAAGAAGACLAVLLAIAASAAVPRDLRSAKEKEIAMELVGSAENSSLDWRAQYGYIEDIHDGRGYTGGIIGFTSGTGDMLEVLGLYTRARSSNPLVPCLRALRDVNGTSSHRGLGRRFVIAWRRAARDPRFSARSRSNATRCTSIPPSHWLVGRAESPRPVRLLRCRGGARSGRAAGDPRAHRSAGTHARSRRR